MRDSSSHSYIGLRRAKPHLRKAQTAKDKIAAANADKNSLPHLSFPASWLEPGKTTIGFAVAEWARGHGTLLCVRLPLALL